MPPVLAAYVFCKERYEGSNKGIVSPNDSRMKDRPKEGANGVLDAGPAYNSNGYAGKENGNAYIKTNIVIEQNTAKERNRI